MAARTPDGYGFGQIPTPTAVHTSRGYGLAAPFAADSPHLSSSAVDFGQPQGQPAFSSPLAQSMQQPTLGAYDDSALPLSSPAVMATPSRSGTLKKKNSLSRKGSLKRSGSRKSLHAGSIKGMQSGSLDGDSGNFNSIFYTPIPTQGAPTEILANRFQGKETALFTCSVSCFLVTDSASEILTTCKSLEKVS
jgi:hypothetical protein